LNGSGLGKRVFYIDVDLYICLLCHKEKQKKKSFPKCLSRGTRGRVVFLKSGTYSSPSAWDGSLGEEDFLKKSNFSSSVALREEDFYKKR
jgi:hypothetical protein